MKVSINIEGYVSDYTIIVKGDINGGLIDETEINMTSIVIVGNKNTYVEDGRMITPRGYTL